MSKLFWKIFVPILIAMVSLILVSILIVANSGQQERHHAQEEIFRVYDEAKDLLWTEDSEALQDWLKKNGGDIKGLDLYITLRGERIDILGRSLPARQEMLGRLQERRLRGGRRGDQKYDRFPNLVSQSGEVYRIHFARKPRSLANLIRNESIFWPLLLTMIAISTLLSYGFARMIVKPIQRLSLGAQRIADGNLKERVTPDLQGRDDEIGVLASDFDHMAEQVDVLLETQKKLLHSQRRMLRDVSHELRSPLARMQVAVGLAEKRSNNVISPELERIETEIETLNDMIAKILSLVKLQNLSIMQKELKWQQGDVVALLKTLVKSANYEAQEKDVTVDLNGIEKAPINMVTELIRSALENVIRNAIQYSPDSSKVEIDIKQSNETVHISVSDQGGGVPDEALDNLFEPFYRVSQAREHNQGTGGIGLAIAKQAVEIHDGKIWAENLPNGFSIHILLSTKQSL